MSRLTPKLLALLTAGALGACSLTIDETRLGGGSKIRCSDKEKACNVEGETRCVGLDDPSFGCSRRSCIPCSLPKATAICSPASGECVVGACHGTWDDCDGINSNGCEVNTADDVENCGRCGDRCPPVAHAEAACGSTSCYVRLCDDGYKNCNDDFEDGCEIDIRTDREHCGDCESACDGDCVDGVCQAH